MYLQSTYKYKKAIYNRLRPALYIGLMDSGGCRSFKNIKQSKSIILYGVQS